MRRLNPRPKDWRNVPIPGELRDALHDVFALLEQAKHDPDVVLDHDDAIQVGPVCGGRYGRDARPYVLSYHPTGEGERGRWSLTLHGAEIEAIGDGSMTELWLYCCTASDCRCKFREADAPCSLCDYIDDPDFGTFTLPQAEAILTRRGVTGLSVDSSREQVVALLGAPDVYGGGMKVPPLGYIWPWMGYRRADGLLRFEFNKTGTRIRNVTVMERGWEPGQ